ncbi:MAG: hypothetical protein ACXWEY_09335 [Bacteroidia bacterium]
MKKIILIQLMVLIAFSACRKNPLCTVKSGNEGIIIKSYPMDNSLCWRITEKNFMIRNDSEFNAIVVYDSTTHEYCKETRPEKIDFKQFTLLGLRASTNGGGGFLRTATRNDSEKKITYEVYPNTCSYTKDLYVSYNMVLIPKVADDYTVEFRLKKD